MKQRIIRLRLDNDVYTEYKKFCIDHDLSITKQTSLLILEFMLNITESEKHLKECLKHEKNI